MTNYQQSVEEEIKHHYERAAILNALVHKSVEDVAKNVCNRPGSNMDHMDSAKMGCYMAWVERLVTLLDDKNIDWLIENLEK
jgi:hypothetical protein